MPRNTRAAHQKSLRIGVFGLGEAGGEIAGDLAAAGVTVFGFDPASVPTPPAVTRVDSAHAAVAGVDVVLAVTPGADAITAASQASDAFPDQVLYADLSTNSAATKVEIADIVAAARARFVDIALMTTVPGNGLRTPALASGPGARPFVDQLSAIGMRLDYVGDEPGVAATRKLLRSVVLKGFAAVVIESMRAAQRAGLADEVWANLVDQFTACDEEFMRRMVEGTAPHAIRRHHEMQAATELLGELGVDPVMTRSTVESLAGIPAEGVPRLPNGLVETAAPTAP